MVDEENISILIVSKRSKKPTKCISLSVKLIQIAAFHTRETGN